MKTAVRRYDEHQEKLWRKKYKNILNKIFKKAKKIFLQEIKK